MAHPPFQRFQFPPPIQMTSNVASYDYSFELLPVELHPLDPSTIKSNRKQQNTSHSDGRKSINCDEHNITRTLTQYEQYRNYRMYSSVLMHGFARESQAQISSIIPTDIIKMCLLYYFEEANDSIRLAYNLYKRIHGKPIAGDKVMSIIQSNQNCSGNTTQILDDLIQFKFIRIVSRKSTFSQLLLNIDKINAKTDLTSTLCTFQFMKNVSDAFHQYSHSM
eukprot:670143_1